MPNKSLVKSVCIDDFALKKRVSYGTIMVDIETGCVVDLLESREMDDVSNWLKTFPNIKIVSRDGSHTYASAIFKAFPDALQISDRFHILKNLNEAVILHFYKIFKGRVAIPITPSTEVIKRTILDSNNLCDRILLVKKLYTDGKSQTEIKCITNFSSSTIKKYLKTSEKDIPEPQKTVRERQHIEAIQKVNEKAEWVRKLSAEGHSIYNISKVTGFVPNTIKKYLNQSFTPINGHYGNNRKGPLSPFRDEVIEMRSKGMTYTEITEIIRLKGYTGTVDALRGFISKEKRIQNDLRGDSSVENIELIERKWLIQLLFKPLCKVKGISEEQFNAVVKEYPQAGVLYDLVSKFKENMFSKKSQLLNSWMQEAEGLGIPELNSFVNGLKNDIIAVNNAIELKYNNGLAEGSVNKIKVIKRIMYGRNNFDLLRNKVLLLENRKFN